MAIKKIQMRPEGANDYADVLHPETSADMVKFADGTTVESHKAEIATTSAKGHVQLSDSTSSTSTSLSATANAVSVTYNKAVEALNKANEAFQSANNGKNLLETTIVGKGGTVSKVDSVATFEELNSGILGLGGGVKKVQRGVSAAFNNSTTTSVNITINSVDTEKSIVRVSYPHPYTTSPRPGSCLSSITLINATTIRITRTSTLYPIAELVWEVIEFDNVKKLQKGSMAATYDNTVVNIAISSVDMSKSLVFVSWTGGEILDARSLLISPYLTTPTNLRIYSTGVYGGITYYWQVIEFN